MSHTYAGIVYCVEHLERCGVALPIVCVLFEAHAVNHFTRVGKDDLEQIRK